MASWWLGQVSRPLKHSVASDVPGHLAVAGEADDDGPAAAAGRARRRRCRGRRPRRCRRTGRRRTSRRRWCAAPRSVVSARRARWSSGTVEPVSGTLERRSPWWPVPAARWSAAPRSRAGLAGGVGEAGGRRPGWSWPWRSTTCPTGRRAAPGVARPVDPATVVSVAPSSARRARSRRPVAASRCRRRRRRRAPRAGPSRRAGRRRCWSPRRGRRARRCRGSRARRG